MNLLGVENKQHVAHLADEQHMRGIRNSKEMSWRQMSVMCLSDGSRWPATTAEYQKKKKKK